MLLGRNLIDTIFAEKKRTVCPESKQLYVYKNLCNRKIIPNQEDLKIRHLRQTLFQFDQIFQFTFLLFENYPDSFRKFLVNESVISGSEIFRFRKIPKF